MCLLLRAHTESSGGLLCFLSSGRQVKGLTSQVLRSSGVRVRSGHVRLLVSGVFSRQVGREGAQRPGQGQEAGRAAQLSGVEAGGVRGEGHRGAAVVMGEVLLLRDTHRRRESEWDGAEAKCGL